MKVNIKKEYYSTTECAEILQVSRITIFNWIQKKRIVAKKYAGNYIIPVNEIEKIQTERGLRDDEKKTLRSFTRLLFKEYGDFLKVLE